ncbi:family 16 glycosylhydrolase [Mangrovivirga sp. M17]|uniref:Family 16 glycosylhydrolase n=1 Tax=Mangrovivirga halotolerans TaxID=2993936 RepID=A0ABT3RQT4_9BACT|nr:family 16 glycosylhydrolase [Mangrovivirga halotolerans]MCX2744139.1 family 16 glycosylhydrolase [Mangrovivirga halotolerans]
MKNFNLKMRAFICIAMIFMVCHSVQAQCPNIVWADEFEGTTLDLNKWSYQIGDGCAESICGWGNNELQSYQEANVTLSNGQLHITAKKERIRGKQYTSGRIRTLNKGDFTYGRFEALIKLPSGAGLWPAFWMLPTDEVYGGWPTSGEIDIMEFVGANPDETLGYMHYGATHQYQGTTYKLHNGTFPEGFHEFAIEWEPNEVRWYVDGVLFQTKTDADLSPEIWPFNERFHMLLNVAVGGNLGGEVDDSIFPATMDVEYVRVYDGFKPYITGDRVVVNAASSVTYKIGNISNNTNVSWTVPAGATIVSGQGSPEIVVDFGNASGSVNASFSTGCETVQLGTHVIVEPPFIKDFSFENFDEPATATLDSYTGTFTEVSNPSQSGINTSALSGEYVRNSTETFDVLVYNVSNITNAAEYVNKDKKFYMDVYTEAPVGTDILIQLETPDATPTNYPSGRHSRYVATTSVQNQWERLYFTLLDRPDPAADDAGVGKMIILFNSNTQTGDTYYFDNLDSYRVDEGGTSNQPPSISITAPADGSTFDSGSIVALQADATDTDGSVNQVEYFVDGNRVGIATSSPFEVDWTIGTGTFSVTATATDDQGATTTSAAISVTGQQTGTASEVFVSSIITGTTGIGRGAKVGTAEVTIVDDLGNPVSGADVTGTFSGSFSESVQATTNSSGVASFVTSQSAKGSLTVDFCVDDVVYSLPYNSGNNVLTCTNGSQARFASEVSLTEDQRPFEKAMIYPNPAGEEFKLYFQLRDNSSVRFEIYDLKGSRVYKSDSEIYSEGNHTIEFNGVLPQEGIFLLHLITDQDIYKFKVLKTN